MKKYLFYLLAIVMFNQNSSAQCQNTFRTQSEVNVFGGCSTLGKLVIVSSPGGNDEIVDLTPLLAITYVAGDVSLSLGNLENIKGLNNITTITGSLQITGATSLSDLSGVATSQSNAFSSLYSIGGELDISSNSSLLNISGFAQLNNCSGISIRNNNKLQNIQGINNLVLASSYLNISESNSLQAITGFNSLYTIGALNIIGLNALKDISGFQNVDNIGNSTIGENPSLETISGFGNMSSFGNLSITGNSSLTTLSVFNGKSITDTKSRLLNIAYNATLKSITGFKNAQITSVNINNNDLLTEISGFTNLISAEEINMNSDMNLNTISGFNSLISAKYIGIRGNKSLTSLTGLFPNIDYQSVKALNLNDNLNLSVCSIPWICSYINNGGFSNISHNATNCNTATEINDNCKLLSLNTNEIEEKFLSYPNPVSEVIKIEGKNNTVLDKIVITDLTGKIILEQTQNTNQINVQNLANGIYILEAISGTEKWHTKFIKK